MVREGAAEREFMIYLLIYSSKLAYLQLMKFRSNRPISFKWRVTVSGELMFLENYGNCDVTNTVSLMTSQNNSSLRFLINTVTFLLLIFRRVSR